MVSLIYYMVSEINSLMKFENVFFFDKYAITNNLRNKMQITHFLMASKNINFDHVFHVIVYRWFSYSCTWLWRMNKLFLSNEAISIAVRDFLKSIITLGVKLV